MTTVFETHGLACPHCGTDDRLNVEARTVVRPVPAGTDIVADHAWRDSSHVVCDACGHEGAATKFSGRKSRMARQLHHLRGLIDRTMWDHVYCEREGIVPGPDCEYTLAMASIDELLGGRETTACAVGASR